MKYMILGIILLLSSIASLYGVFYIFEYYHNLWRTAPTSIILWLWILVGLALGIAEIVKDE